MGINRASGRAKLGAIDRPAPLLPARARHRRADFIRIRDAIARCLAVVPRIERDDIEALGEATATPIPKETPCIA